MKRILALFMLALSFILSPARVLAQADSPWQKVMPVARFGYGGLLSVDWSPITGQLAAASERGLQFYDPDLTLQARRDTPNAGAILSPDMRFVAMVEERGLIVRNTTSWEPVLALESLVAPSWSPDSTRLAVWNNSGILQVWNVPAASLQIEFTELISDGADVQWSPDSTIVAVPAGETIVMANVHTGDVIRIHDFALIAGFEWSRDGRWLVISGLPDPLPLDQDPDLLVPYSLVRLDAVTGELVTTYALPQPSNSVIVTTGQYVSISPDGRYIAARIMYAASLEEQGWAELGMAIFDLETGRPVPQPGEPAEPLIFDADYTSWSPDSSRFATSTGNTLQIFDMTTGQLAADLPAYINVTDQTIWTDDGTGLVAAGGLWDVTGEFPQYTRLVTMSTPANDRYVPPDMPPCSLNYRTYCPDFLVPDPLVFDYERPPYDWNLQQWDPARNLAISYEIDIEYPDTPEYDDDIPPEERYIIWDIQTGDKLDERVYLGLQTAWVYDIEGANYIESESRAFNIRHNTYFLGIGDDEIVDLREGTPKPLQDIQIWEWRRVWFGPEGRYVYTYDTDGRFKVFDPFTGEQLYTTVPAPEEAIWFTADLTLTFVQDHQEMLHIYQTDTGETVLEAYTANTYPLLLWNEDRSRLAIGGENHAVIIYDMATQKRLGILRGHQGTITSMAWNPACDYTTMTVCRYVFASSDSTGEVILWGTERRDQLVQAMPSAPAAPKYALPTAEINFADLTPIWSYVTFTDEYGQPQAQTIRWTEAGIRVNDDTYYTGQLRELPEAPGGANWLQPAAVARDGRMLSSSGTVYDESGNPLASVTASHIVTDAAFDPLGTRVLTAERGDQPQYPLSGWVREYSAESGQFIQAWGGGNPGFDGIAYSPNRRWIATTTLPYYQMGARVQIWFADRFNTQFSSLIGHKQRITALFWDGEDVITSSLDGTVRRWDIRTGWPLARWDQPTHAPITQMVWYDDSSLLLSAGDNLYVLAADTLTVQRTFEGVGGGRFDWSPDKKQVTVIGSDSLIRIVDLSGGAVVAEENQHMPMITHLAWNPDGDLLAASRADGSLILLDGITGAMTALLRPNGPEICSIAWSPDGSKLLLDIVKGPVQILNGSDGVMVGEIVNPWRRAGVWWSPDGSRIALGTFPDPTHDVYNAVSLLNIYAADGTLLSSFDLKWADFIFYDNVKPFVLAWSPGGNRIAAFYRNGVRVWDTATGAILVEHMNALNLADPDHEKYPFGRPPDDPRISLTVWADDTLYFWRPDSAWSLDLAADTLTQRSDEGLPPGTVRRADGLVVLANSVIVHAASNYHLQQLATSYVDAAWHPTCWTQDCPAVLAIAHGSTVTLFGYTHQVVP